MTSKTLINNLVIPNQMEDSNLDQINVRQIVSQLVTNSTFYKEKKSAIKSSRAYYADQPLSINVGVKYEPYVFEKNLKKNHRSKLEEEVYKIKQYTVDMQRADQEAKVKDKNFEKMRQLDMQSLEKRIPKLAILHKIQAFHRRKCPQFDINKCLNRKKQYSEDVSREEMIEMEEKKISQQVARKTLLQRQQDIIKRCLSPKMKEVLGVHIEIKNDSFGDESNNHQTYNQARGLNSFGFSNRTPSNRHQTPCCSSFHGDNIQKNYMNKSFNSQRAQSSSENRRKNLVNQSLEMNMQSYGQSYQESQVVQPESQKRHCFLFSTNHQNLQQSIEQNNIQQYNQNSYNSSTLQSTIYQAQNKRKISSAMCIPQIQRPIQENSTEREKQDLSIQRKQRENSPMRFLFKKYENVVNESYDDFRIEMKNIADIYLPNQKQRKNSSAGTQQTDVNNAKTQNTEINQARKLSVLQILNSNTHNANNSQNIFEQLSSQQNVQQNASQRKQSISFSQNNQQKTRFNNLQSSTPTRQQQQQTSVDNFEKQNAENSVMPTQMPQKTAKGRFIEKNQGVQQLNKTLIDFEQENQKIQKKVNNFQKNLEKSDKNMDEALEMRRKCDSYNVSDFLMKVQQKKKTEQEEKQKQEAIRRKCSKVERNTQNQQQAHQKN
ncbi:hypothetical protein ABPG72_014258 [Tetrahymena utriculariae]